MKIGSLDFKYGLVLAPMAGFSDSAMRTVCYERGAEYSVTEMVSATAVIYGDLEVGVYLDEPFRDSRSFLVAYALSDKEGDDLRKAGIYSVECGKERILCDLLNSNNLTAADRYIVSLCDLAAFQADVAHCLSYFGACDVACGTLCAFGES